MVKAVSVLKDHLVLEENIVLANLFCTPPATQTITTAFPLVTYLQIWFLFTFHSEFTHTFLSIDENIDFRNSSGCSESFRPKVFWDGLINRLFEMSSCFMNSIIVFISICRNFYFSAYQLWLITKHNQHISLSLSVI